MENPIRIELTILGQPASMKNSRQIVHFGKRLASIKSKKARDYEASAGMQIPPSKRVMMEGPVRVTMTIYYASERPDLDESVILDVMQSRFKVIGGKRVCVRTGIYINDRAVREKHIFHRIDKLRPRAEIIVESL